MGFGAAIRRASQKVLVQTGEQAKKVVVKFTENVIEDTPVKTGRTKGGWRSTVGSPYNTETIRLDPTGELAKAEARVVVRQLPDNKDWTFYFSNLTPYASKLEYLGWSQQAPNGMVRINVAKLPMLIRQAIVEGKL
jgi:hypothetical protein